MPFLKIPPSIPYFKMQLVWTKPLAISIAIQRPVSNLWDKI